MKRFKWILRKVLKSWLEVGWKVAVSVSVVAILFGAGVGMWGKDFVEKQSVAETINIMARQQICNANSMTGEEHFTISTHGKTHRILRFTVKEDIEPEDIAQPILENESLIKGLKELGFWEIQISSAGEENIISIDLIEGDVKKKSHV